ncbi:NfeD family protein [Chloracidobacterium aggregatum]|jgi:hypothetical protein|uniref:NfeD family protein n=1 Tax=Chloracidobacterium aggregatum TaxID=2851959 RepID=UPI001B8DA9A5|nr:NfeD family protein [Chloracidobacterium aggregatum]QUV96168.1 NfeD family protein [Chloracidobacterium sp. E]
MSGLFSGSTLEMFCWGLALFSTTLLVLKLTVGTVLDGLDGHLDGHLAVFGVEDPSGAGGGFKAILVGLMVTGWSGVICFQLTRLSPLMVLVTALSAGVMTFTSAVWLLRRVRHLESDGTLQPANAIGRFGTVYLTIPAQGSGTGQIQIEIQGRLATLEAITDGPAIPTGTRVFVIDTGQGVLRVLPEQALDPLPETGAHPSASDVPVASHRTSNSVTTSST